MIDQFPTNSLTTYTIKNTIKTPLRLDRVVKDVGTNQKDSGHIALPFLCMGKNVWTIYIGMIDLVVNKFCMIGEIISAGS